MCILIVFFLKSWEALFTFQFTRSSALAGWLDSWLELIRKSFLKGSIKHLLFYLYPSIYLIHLLPFNFRFLYLSFFSFVLTIILVSEFSGINKTSFKVGFLYRRLPNIQSFFLPQTDSILSFLFTFLNLFASIIKLKSHFFFIIFKLKTSLPVIKIVGIGQELPKPNQAFSFETTSNHGLLRLWMLRWYQFDYLCEIKLFKINTSSKSQLGYLKYFK